MPTSCLNAMPRLGTVMSRSGYSAGDNQSVTVPASSMSRRRVRWNVAMFWPGVMCGFSARYLAVATEYGLVPYWSGLMTVLIIEAAPVIVLAQTLNGTTWYRRCRGYILALPSYRGWPEYGKGHRGRASPRSEPQN